MHENFTVRRLSMCGAAALAILGGAPCSSRAGDAMHIARDPMLQGTFEYRLWLNQAGKTAPLPAPGADGLIRVAIPQGYQRPGAMLEVMRDKDGLTARLPIHVSGDAPPRIGRNLITNGTFSEGIANWLPTLAGEGAHADLTIASEPVLPPGVPGKVAQVHVSSLGPRTTNIQLAQGDIDLRDGQPYTIAFWCRADRDRSPSVTAARDTIEGPNAGLQRAAHATTGWRRFAFPFRPAGLAPSRCRIAINIGEALGEVDLADILLHPGAEPGAPEGLAAPHVSVLENASFRWARITRVKILFRGHPIADAMITARFGDNGYSVARITPVDSGVGRLTDLPMNTKLTLYVRNGDQSIKVERTLTPDAKDVLPDISVPDSWVGVHTADGLAAQVTAAGGAQATKALIGAWEGRAGASKDRVRFTFAPSETGTMVYQTRSGAALTSAFRWRTGVRPGQIVINQTTHSWMFRGTGRRRRLILTLPTGEAYTLYPITPNG